MKMKYLNLLLLLVLHSLVFQACSTQNETINDDTDIPYPIYHDQTIQNAPSTYKGLKLSLTDDGRPTVTPVDNSIGVVCIGMSNAYQECEKFVKGTQDFWSDQINSQVEIINCAVGGHAIEKWIDPEFDPVLWEGCSEKIARHGLSDKQIRVVLHKAANQFTRGPDGKVLPYYPDPASDYYNLTDNLDLFAKRVTEFFPSLQAVFTTSRSYGGFSDRPDRGEPLSYEEGHALNKWLEDNSNINNVWFGWGPYIWAPRCTTGIRNGHGICYNRDDYEPDAIHPSSKGEIKIATLWHQKLQSYSWYRN